MNICLLVLALSVLFVSADNEFVVDLDDSNFDELVSNSDDIWFVNCNLLNKFIFFNLYFL